MEKEKFLIDGGRIIDALQRSLDENPDKKGTAAYHAVRTFISALRRTPPVDAVEVVHGEWLVIDADSGEPDGHPAFLDVQCSRCGYENGVENGQQGWTYGEPFPMNYCPSCGAMMDGEREDDGGMNGQTENESN